MSIIIDSALNFSKALGKVSSDCPAEILHALILKEVEYFSFDEKLHRGQLVINQSAEKDLEEIFELMRKIKFPIAQAIPISQYQNDDLQSMEANNTSAFNYRMILNT
ncbi:MAG: M15 family peptidase, partial [Candidatus Gracilibacteria bacterium]